MEQTPDKAQDKLHNDYATLCARLGDVEIAIESLEDVRTKILSEAMTLKNKITKKDSKTEV